CNNFNISDSDNDGIGDTTVNIPGGDNIDRFPLAPGVRLEWEMVADRATTGEDIPIEITAENFNIEILENLSFSYGNITSGFIKRDLDHTETKQTVFISVPENSIDPIQIKINTSDSLGHNKSIGPISIPVCDNDHPLLELLSSTSTIQAGDDLLVVVSVYDNIEVNDVWAELSGVLEKEVHLQEIDGLWHLRIGTLPTILGSLTLSIHANDSSGNLNAIDLDDVVIIDGDPPGILDDLTPVSISTGDELNFFVVCDDTDGIAWVETEFKQGSIMDNRTLDQIEYSISKNNIFPPGFDPSNYNGNWSAFLTNVIIPSNTTDNIEYRFIISDKEGNILNGPWKEIEVSDSISPDVSITWNARDIFTGSELVINFVVEDNIGILQKWLLITQNDNELMNTTDIGNVSFSIPINLSGNIVIRAFAIDEAGNLREFISDPIEIIDNIKPKIISISHVKMMVGETKTISIEATDNIEVTSIRWSFNNNEGFTNEAVLNPDVDGEFLLNITVKDAQGNTAYQNVPITVEKKKVSENSSYTAIIVIAISIAIVLIIVAFFFSRRKMTGTSDEPEESLLDDSPHQEVADRVEE
ncbi:MAG: hypothetical protein U9R75_06940, partial [Candidatus Thermoplasmatota archaeon]|nr:hypothetical protein [Candidatus Thermoplasmatota archaeon]